MDNESMRCHPPNDTKAASTVDQMFDLLSLGSSLSSVSGGIAGSRHGLRSWDPWTNRCTRPRSQAPEAEAEADIAASRSAAAGTRKSAGGLYDSIVRAERLAAVRAARRAAALLNTNNNTTELEGGLKDVQRHTAGGQRTTVITRLASETVTGGGVLDVNFVMDSNSSNTPDNASRKIVTTDDSNDTNNWRWNHDATGEGAGKQRGSKDPKSQQRSSKDHVAEQLNSKYVMDKQARGSKESAGQERSSKESAGQERSSKESAGQQKRTSKEYQEQQRGPPRMFSGQRRASKESLKQQSLSRDTTDQLRAPNQQRRGQRQRQPDQPWEWESQEPQDSQDPPSESPEPQGLGQQSQDPDASGEGDESDEAEGDSSEGRDLEDEEEPPQQGEEKQNVMSARKKLSICHLQKEGVLIGCMNVFADVMRKEFVVLLTDSVVEAFLIEPSQFRAIATRTGCEIEVTRRILNRRIGMHRWVKYLVLTIKGPNMTAIDQCDRLMVKLFPPYKIRKEYLEAAPVALFVKESYPDNTNLYFNFQRTGPTRDRLGELRLRTPFGPCSTRQLENTPWQYADWRLFKGMLEPRNLAAEHVIKHVYPEWGTETGNFIDKTQKWELAGDAAIDIEKKKSLERSLRVKLRKMDAEPLFVENT